MTKNSDWRICYQEEYLGNKTFYFHAFKPRDDNDHEHCQFCWEKINKNGDGYSTIDDCYWVCEECFDDFKDMFGFKLFEKSLFNNRTITAIIEDEIENLSDGEKVYSIKRILQLLSNLKNVVIEEEKIFITPIITQIFIDRSPKKFSRLKKLCHEVYVSNITDLSKELKIIFLEMQRNAGRNRQCTIVESVCLEHEPIGDTRLLQGNNRRCTFLSNLRHTFGGNDQEVIY